MHHISGETSISQIKESTLISQTHIQDASAVSTMRVLSDHEVLGVAGGPEVDVESGSGG
ncbi:hypothetical protein H8L32_05170 [Undibacterium sp. CY18W]|uniref:Uncharacterized protein n=1 Tax=Undibacterium hunanense TaxID=2762292 RepID=A0ABR6ZMP6_9BURK|nr:hypothetical protein [Undibacterium hunanense]MBC3916859.1 hypothetical protein [Undibacterium hunanense]